MVTQAKTKVGDFILPFLHMGTQQLDMFDVMAFTSLVLTVVNGQALVSSLLQGHH